MRKENNITIIDLSIKRTSPAGSCVLYEVHGLSEHFSVTAFTTENDDLPSNVSVLRIGLPKFLPNFLRYVFFSLFLYFKVRKRRGDTTLLQTTQGQYPWADISYAHFCNLAYLTNHFAKSDVGGLKRIARKMTYLFNYRMEKLAFQNSKIIVVPSKGLMREISSFYPQHKDKIQVIPNPVDLKKFYKPTDFDRNAMRLSLGLPKEDFIVAFSALGDFARKGLGLLMEAQQKTQHSFPHLRLLIIGGKEAEIEIYRKKAVQLGISDRINFVGTQKNISPYLWVSDIFSLPSSYETFSLVAIQAATAGLPLLVTPIYGVEEYIKDGYNGWVVERNTESIAAVFNQIVANEFEISAMSKHILESVDRYDVQNFQQAWTQLYTSLFSDKGTNTQHFTSTN